MAISLFAFIIRYELVFKNSVYFYRIISLHYILRLGTISLASLRTARLFITVPIRIRFSMTRQQSPYLPLTCSNCLHIDSFRLSSHAIYAISGCLLPIDNRGFDTTLCALFGNVAIHLNFITLYHYVHYLAICRICIKLMIIILEKILNYINNCHS